jgi:hypothetical protein
VRAAAHCVSMRLCLAALPAWRTELGRTRSKDLSAALRNIIIPQYDPRDTEPRCGLRRSRMAMTQPTATSMMMITVATLATSALKSAPGTSKGSLDTCASGATREARTLRQIQGTNVRIAAAPWRARQIRSSGTARHTPARRQKRERQCAAALLAVAEQPRTRQHRFACVATSKPSVS